jgi:hypothetical protein
MSYSKADADVISGKLTPMSYCTIGPLSGPVPSRPQARHRRRGPPETPRNWTFTRPHPPTGETWPRHALTPAAPSGCRPSGQVSAARRDRGGRIATTVARALPTMASHPRTVRSAPPAQAHRRRVGASAGRAGPTGRGGRNRIQFGFTPAGRSALVWPGPASAKQRRPDGRAAVACRRAVQERAAESAARPLMTPAMWQHHAECRHVTRKARPLPRNRSRKTTQLTARMTARTTLLTANHPADRANEPR